MKFKKLFSFLIVTLAAVTIGMNYANAITVSEERLTGNNVIEFEFVNNMGAMGDSTPLYVILEEGETLKVSEYVANPSFRYYDFLGWKNYDLNDNKTFTTLSYSDLYDEAGEPKARYYSCYSQFDYETIPKGTGTYYIEIAFNGGSAEGYEVDEYETMYSKEVAAEEFKTISLPTPKREGAEFLGWYLFDVATESYVKVTEITSATFKNSDLANVYAAWKIGEDKDSEFHVIFDANGGKLFGEDTFKSAYNWNVPPYSGYMIITNSYAPVRDGYTFAGWYDNKDFKDGFYDAIEYHTFMSEEGKKETVTLYAKWVAAETPKDTTTETPKETVTTEVTEAKKVSDEGAKLVQEVVDGKKVEGISEELAKKIVEANGAVLVVLDKTEVKADDVKEDASKVIELVGNDAKVVGYYDINVLVKINDETAGKITKLGDKVEVTLAVPNDLPKVAAGSARVYTVVRVHDGKAEELKTTVNSDGTLTFTTDSFSTYAITYKDVKNPNTVDNVVLYITLSLVSVAGIAACLVIKKKMNK